LQETGITISHIDNPVVFNQFENNEDFINKTEESIRTLKTHQKELRDYSRIIRLADNLEALRLSSLVRRLFQKRQQRWRMQLCGSNPSLFLFNLYKIGYYL
jgi:regulator of replication initiation timing